jgi:hypothetical protein
MCQIAETIAELANLKAMLSPHPNANVMRFIVIGLASCFFGCGAENTAPTPFTQQHRETVKQSLVRLGAKVTAEIPETAYLSLRNSHVEIRELGVVIESAPRVQRDIQDFAIANEAIASGFLNSGETEDYKKWLRAALAREASPVLRSDYDQFKVTLSRKPLRSIYTRKQSAEAE